jgi:hypothetical protein
MPALVVWGHRVPLVAEDDVRTMSKYAFFGRMCQVGLWIPSMILIMVRDRKTRSCIPPEEEEEEESHTLDRFITNSAAVVPSNEIVLRTFVFLSMTTIFVSCVLDTIMYVKNDDKYSTKEFSLFFLLVPHLALPIHVFLRALYIYIYIYIVFVSRVGEHRSKSKRENPCDDCVPSNYSRSLYCV